MLVGDGLFLFLWIGLWIYAFIDSITTDAARVRGLPKTVWVILILIFSGFAAIAWFIFGRPRRGVVRGAERPATPRLTWQAGGGNDSRGPLGGGPRGRSAPVAPDDNPEFLRQMQRDIQRDHRRDKPGPDGAPDQPPV